MTDETDLLDKFNQKLNERIEKIVLQVLEKYNVTHYTRTEAIGKSIPCEKTFSPFLASDLIPKVDKTWDTFEGHQPIV